MPPDFAQRLIAWQKQHGRHDLPWQNTCDPYAIWVSEIMLQQTQVAAVIPYYRRFMARFPDVLALAAAEEDAVLQHWSGLGYYSRARNLHAAARIVVGAHAGRFPESLEAVMALPGIGRSTAAAVCAFAFGQRQAILDGNVKRVLARCFGVAGWPGLPAVEKQLWQLAETLLPHTDLEPYTQGLMDLGATVCKRTKPDCALCPLQPVCVARAENRVAELPAPKPCKALPERETIVLIIWNGGQIMLEKRPSAGIWGGLWSLPEIAPGSDPAKFLRERYGIEAETLPAWPCVIHAFTHFRLRIQPQPMQVKARRPVLQQSAALWLDPEDAVEAALPSPIRTLIKRL